MPYEGGLSLVQGVVVVEVADVVVVDVMLPEVVVVEDSGYVVGRVEEKSVSVVTLVLVSVM